MQSILIAGDSLDFTREVPDYPATDGWTLTYRLAPRMAGTAITFGATASGSLYRVQVLAATTAAWTAGEYSWAAYVTKAADRYTVDSGSITIQPDPGVVAASDTRSHARRVLAAIEAVIEGRATRDQEEYTIGNRSLKRTPIRDLLTLRDRYKSEVNAEDAGRRLLAGETPGYALQVRL
jgi:hypothetical protein